MTKRIVTKFLSESALIRKMLTDRVNGESLWHEFLNRYYKLILKVIWRMENDHDSVMDKFLWICTKLSENNFALIAKYETRRENSPKFSTWLVAVVRNLCVDAHRSIHGRKRMPKALQNLDTTERKVFNLFYLQGASIEEIHHSINSGRQNNEINIPELIDKIESVLGKSRSQPERKEFLVSSSFLSEDIQSQDDENINEEFQEAISKWMDNLTVEEKLIIKLKFWGNLGAREIAEQLELGSEQVVYGIIRNCLAELRKTTEKLLKQ